MNIPALESFRARLAAGEPVHGLWITLESPSITEMAVGLGLDWILIDAEHGHLDWAEVVAHLRCAVRSNTVALVRVADHSPALIKRALDLGADGVVVPWVETPEQLKNIVAAAKYPPTGIRGIGAERATAWGQCFAEHAEQADDQVLVVPMIESVTAGQNIRQLVETPGVEVFFFGSADFSATAGHPGQWEGPGVAEQILAAKEVVHAAGKHSGAVALNHENLMERHKQGFRMLAVGIDTGLLLRSLHQSLKALGIDRRLRPDLRVED